MKDIVIKIDRKTSQVFLNKKVLGINGENLQGNIIFEFIDDFVDGVAWLEIEVGQTKGYLALTKEDNSYKLPILSSLLANKGNLTMQLRITAKENAEDVPVFKSNIFYLEVKEAINSVTTIPEEYPTWLDVASAKLAEMERLEEEITQKEKIRQEQQEEREEYYNDLRENVENGELNGATFIPDIDEEYNLSWSNDKGLKNPETVNIKGEKGDKGDCNFATFDVVDGKLIMYKTEDMLLDFKLEKNRLKVVI